MTIQEFRKAFNGLPSHGWLTVEEALLLVDAAERTVGPMIEVGSYYGRSACMLSQIVEPVNGSLYRRRSEADEPTRRRQLVCVDPWADEFSKPTKGDDVYLAFLSNIRAVQGAVVLPARMRVEDWTPAPAEFVYLDGSHTYDGTKNQVMKALECKPRVIAIHDVNDSGGGVLVKKAAVEILGPWNERVERLAVWDVRQ